MARGEIGLMSRPRGYVEPGFLRAVARTRAIQQIKRRSYESMQIKGGQTVLDVGCGPGTDTIEMARLVGPSGQSVGVDYDRNMVAEASKQALLAGVGGWTLHRQSESYQLPFTNGYFHSCRSERLFQHLPLAQAVQTLAEMARVTLPGGRIVVIDTDWATFSIDTDEVDIERRIMQAHAGRLYNGFAGRQLYRLFKEQGLVGTTVELFDTLIDYGSLKHLLGGSEQMAVATGVITSEELQRWHFSLARAQEKGCFFAHLVMVLAAGRKRSRRVI
jgi:ubiquinone/menaquinone biosynthesis C-methylase UbiE